MDTFLNRNSIVNKTANIRMYMYSPSEYTKVKVNYESSTMEIPIQAELKSGMGNWFSLSSPYKTVDPGGKYILSNNEIRFDSNIIGFELNMAVAGYIYIEFRTNTAVCGKTITCADYFASTSAYPEYQYISYQNGYTVTVGYNRIDFPTPLKLLKGTTVYINTIDYTGKIYWEASSSVYYTDYKLISGSTLQRIDSNINYFFHLNLLVEIPFYYFSLNLNLYFSQAITQNVTYNFTNDVYAYQVTKTYNIY